MARITAPIGLATNFHIDLPMPSNAPIAPSAAGETLPKVSFSLLNIPVLLPTSFEAFATLPLTLSIDFAACSPSTSIFAFIITSSAISIFYFL